MELINKEDAVALIKAEMDKIRTHSLVDGTARINLRLAKNIIEDMSSIDLADYVPKEFHDRTCEAMAKRHQEEIADILERADADRPQGEWIPCGERLPSEKDYIGDVVIWCTDKSIVGVGWYYESTKSWATIDDTFPPILGEVIAWMPLPKPWKGADDE